MQKFQVSFIGLSTLFGRTSSLLLKQSPFIKCIKLYDENNIDPALDVAGLNTQCKVKAFLGKEQLKTALKDAHIIVIGEEASSENMNIADPFTYSAPKILDYANAIATTAPEAIIVVAASPVNSLLPLITQMLVHHGCFNCNKVLGATTVDNIRANSLLAAHLKADARQVVLPVIGGSSEETRVPIFSQARPNSFLPTDIKEKIIKGIKKGEVEVRKKKKCPESLNKAYATSRFVNTIMAGLRGEANVTDIALTKTTAVPGVDYFALPIMLGRHGVTQRFGIPTLTNMEQTLVNKAISSMKKDIDKAGVYWRKVASQPFLNSKQPLPAVDLSSDLTNVDTKPKGFLTTHSASSQDGNYPKDILEKRAKKAKPAMANPIDRLFQLKNQTTKEETKPYSEFRNLNRTIDQWQIQNLSEVHDRNENVKTDDESQLASKPDSQEENNVLEKANPQTNDNTKYEKPAVKKPATNNVLSTLIKKTEQIISQNKQSAENAAKEKKETPEEVDEGKKKQIKPKSISSIKVENVLKATEQLIENINRKEIDNKTDLKKINEIMEKNKSKLPVNSKPSEKVAKSKPYSFAMEDQEKERIAVKKQETLIEQMKREKMLSVKLQRIAEKRATNLQKSVLFSRKESQRRIPIAVPSRINTNFILAKGKTSETSVPKPSKVVEMPTENVKKPIKQESKEVKKETKVEKAKSYDLAEIEQPLKAYIGEPVKGKALFCKTTVTEENHASEVVNKEVTKETKNSIKTLSKNQSESKKELDNVTKSVPKQARKRKLKVLVKGANSKPAPKLLYPSKFSKPTALVKSVPVESVDSKDVKKQMKGSFQTTVTEETTKKHDAPSKPADNKTEVDQKFKSEEKKQQAESKVKESLNSQKELKRKGDKSMTLLQILSAHAEKTKVKEVKVEEVKREVKKEVKKEMKKEAPPKVEDNQIEKPPQEDKKAGSFKNLLQMLPATRKNFLKLKDKVKLLEEAKKQAESKEVELKAIAEPPKKVIVINPVNKIAKTEKNENSVEPPSQNENSRSPRNLTMKTKSGVMEEEASKTEENVQPESEIRENEGTVHRMNFIPSETAHPNNQSEIFKKQGKTTTPLQLIQNQQLQKSKKQKNLIKQLHLSENTVSDRLNRTLKSYFRRRSASQKHNDKYSLLLKKEMLLNKHLLHKFNAMKIHQAKQLRPKSTFESKLMFVSGIKGKNPYKNVVLTRKPDGILDSKPPKFLTLFSKNDNLEYDDKELSKSFKQVLKEKQRVPVTVPLAGPNKPKFSAKPKRKKQKTLLHMLTTKKENQLEKENVSSLRKIKLPKDIFIEKKKEECVKIPKNLHTGTCADMVKTIGKSVPTEEKLSGNSGVGTTVDQPAYSAPIKEIDSLPSFSLNEYNCKSNILPNLKFMREHR